MAEIWGQRKADKQKERGWERDRMGDTWILKPESWSILGSHGEVFTLHYVRTTISCLCGCVGPGF